ncbi:hypothetical protein [Floridanema evergladense]|uniref:Uncharacterized protein n=1 Tax=Floridaenema evergladense BLCC-F167 TaxID=3153639 RepID=A0ABV4WD04_9CYAN
MNTDKLNQAVSQAQQAQHQPPQTKQTANKKTRNQTTQKAQSTAQELIENAHTHDTEVSNATLKDAAIHGMSLGQKKVAVFVAACENTYEAGVKAYLAHSANNNASNSEDLNIKGILKDVGLDIDAINEELGKQLALANQNLTLPSTQPLFLLSSADYSN